jgi:hypothetical protein
VQAFAERLRRLGDVTANARHFQAALFVAAIVGFLVAKFGLLSRININWDEFLFLSRVHEFQRGELTSAFQTFHVHLFQWLISVPGNEIEQMFAARYVAFALRVASTILVFLLGARIAGRSGGFVAALASLAFSHLLRHGESFRADPLIAFLFLLTAALLVWRLESKVAVAIAAIAFALAASITVKTAIYVPALAGIVAVIVWSGDADARRTRLRRLALFAAGSAAAYMAFYLVHAAATSAPESEVVTRAAASGMGMMSNPQLEILRRTFRTDWGFWALFMIGFGFAVHDVARRDRAARARAALLLAFLLPLASLMLYRNTFEYFYVTIIPLASLACAYAAARIEGLLVHPRRALVPVLLVAPVAFHGWRHANALRFDRIQPQREVIAAVHEMFPEPVPYLDRCGMISSFPRARVFMSTYVLQRYRERGVPSMGRIVAEDQPRFLLANVSGLALQQPWDTVQISDHRLLQEDFEFLQNNFVWHWGPIWLPGKRLALSGREMRFGIVVGGPYTVEATRSVTIDGALARPGDVVQLETGEHRVIGFDSLTLRFGARLSRPAADPPFRGLFRPL